MTPVGLVGIFLCLFAWPAACARPTPNRLYIFIGLLAVHLGGTITYYLFAQTGPADSNFYYFDRMNFAHRDFALGTVFTIKLVQFLRQAIGGSYFDYFLIFQAFGFWGIVLLMRTFEEIYIKLRVKQTALAYLLLFLPGIHFWTSAIGKDAPLFLAISLACWSAMRLPARLAQFTVAVAIMVLFRTHIALLTVATLAASELFETNSTQFRRFALLVVAICGVVVTALTVQTRFGVDLSSAASISEFLQRREAIGLNVGGETAVGAASYPVKMLSLLFRPFYFDAEGAFALIASMENTVWVFIVGFVVFNLPSALRISRRVYFVRFALIFATLLTILLSLVYYNVGLGARQKMMIAPALFSLMVALWAIRRYRLEVTPVGNRMPQPAATLGQVGEQKHA